LANLKLKKIVLVITADPYSGKVIKVFPLTTSGYEMAAERMVWG